MKKITLLLVAMIALLLFVSCEGAPGAPGQSITGDPGANGNSNVVTVDLAGSDITWIRGTHFGTLSNVYTLSVPELTQDIIDDGTVTGEWNYNGDGSWYPLPTIWQNAAGTSTQILTFSYSLGSITLYAYETGNVLRPSAAAYRFTLTTNNTVMRSVEDPEVFYISPVELDGDGNY